MRTTFGGHSTRRRKMGKIISSLFARGAMRAWQVFVFLLLIQIPCHHCPKGLTERMRAHASECEKLQELKLWSPDEDPKAKRQKQTVLSFGTTNVKVSMGFIFVLVCLGFFLGRPVGASGWKVCLRNKFPIFDCGEQGISVDDAVDSSWHQVARKASDCREDSE